MAELSGFEVLVLAKEIGSALRGTYVNNVYSVGASQLVRLRTPGGDDVFLVVSPKKGAWISNGTVGHAETTEFTSKLRSQLERTKFSGASQFDLDRVFELDFQDGDARRLVVELMPPGNIVVLDRGGKVLLALNEVRKGARRLVMGASYQPPAQRRVSPSDLRPESVKAILMQESTAGKALGKHIALPRKYVAEAMARLGVSDDSPSSELLGEEGRVVRVFGEMVAQARESPKPCICETPAGDEIFVIPPAGLRRKVISESVSELCDVLFLREALAVEAKPSPEEAKRGELEATVAKLKSESESLLAEASKARSSAAVAKGTSQEDALKLLREYGAGHPGEPASPDAAASLLYDRAKELEAKAARSLEAAAKLERKASRIKLSSAPMTKPIGRRRGEWYERFRWFVTTSGKLAVGGRDSQTNAALLRRHLDSDDMVFHADLFGSPFFVLKGGDGMSEEEALEVARATVAFSSAWRTGLGSADAYWVKPDQVASAAPSGEYLPRGSFAIRGKKNFVNKNIVEAAVGLDAKARVMAGPEEAVKKACAHYVVLRPHNEKGSETAKRVFKHLSQWAPENLGLDEVQRAIPAGGGKVVRLA